MNNINRENLIIKCTKAFERTLKEIIKEYDLHNLDHNMNGLIINIETDFSGNHRFLPDSISCKTFIDFDREDPNNIEPKFERYKISKEILKNS